MCVCVRERDSPERASYANASSQSASYGRAGPLDDGEGSSGDSGVDNGSMRGLCRVWLVRSCDAVLGCWEGGEGEEGVQFEEIFDAWGEAQFAFVVVLVLEHGGAEGRVVYKARDRVSRHQLENVVLDLGVQPQQRVQV